MIHETSGLPPRLEDRCWAFWVTLEPYSERDQEWHLGFSLDDVAIFHGKNWYMAREKAAVHFGVVPDRLSSRPAWKGES